MCNRVRWNDVLETPIGLGAMVMFAFQNHSGELTEKIFRVGKDRKVAGEVRRLIRERGVGVARNLGRKAIRRRFETV
jgi:hypothetical protein